MRWWRRRSDAAADAADALQVTQQNDGSLTKANQNVSPPWCCGPSRLVAELCSWTTSKEYLCRCRWGRNRAERPNPLWREIPALLEEGLTWKRPAPRRLGSWIRHVNNAWHVATMASHALLTHCRATRPQTVPDAKHLRAYVSVAMQNRCACRLERARSRTHRHRRIGAVNRKRASLGLLWYTSVSSQPCS